MLNTINVKILLLLILYRSNAEIPHPLHKAENTEKCIVPQLPSKFLLVGKTATISGLCYQVTCNPDLTITGLTCSSYVLRRGCWMSNVNYYKDFPDCCPQVMCNSFNAIKF
ncbi:hypothetical protein RN001_006543 [Aquatica leii]|uniref:Single domain-containing protein n=1 Tax=Aquatica leii TaxID=1421715 RepID=A0AAN7PDT5_9COLE|nr:hypothetical protein RN001_006543 [Aquatica leii]